MSRGIHKISPEALKGISTSVGRGGHWSSIDFDNWLKGKKKSGFDVKENSKGIFLSKEEDGLKEKIFINKKAISVVKKLKKVI